MVVLFGLLWVLFSIVLGVSLIILVVRSAQKKPKKPFSTVALASLVGAVICFIVATVTAMPEADARREESLSAAEPIKDSSAEVSAPAVEPEPSDGISPEPAKSSAPKQEPAPSKSSAKERASTSGKGSTSSASVPVASGKEPEAVKDTVSGTAPVAVTQSASVDEPSSESETVSNPASVSENSESSVDSEFIYAAFDALISDPDYEGAIESIEPLYYNGEANWHYIIVTVPDGWYYLMDYQKERYCQNVTDYVQPSVVLGGGAESTDYVRVHFYDVAGAEVASPKMFGGFKILK